MSTPRSTREILADLMREMESSEAVSNHLLKEVGDRLYLADTTIMLCTEMLLQICEGLDLDPNKIVLKSDWPNVGDRSLADQIQWNAEARPGTWQSKRVPRHLDRLSSMKPRAT